MKKLLIFAVFLVVMFVSAGLLFLPSRVLVERSTIVTMPASTVYTLLNSFKSHNAWSPWAGKDPQAVYTFSGPESGVGAKLSWSGNRMVGRGSQQIILSDAYSRIDVLMDFGDRGQADVHYTIESRNGGVLLTWVYEADVTSGKNFLNALIARYVGIMFDRWIGRDFEAGLANFKAFSEQLPKADFSDLDIRLIDVSAWDILYVSSQVEQDPDSIAAALATAYGEINEFMHANNLFPMAQPLAISRFSSNDGYSFDAAIPVSMPPDLRTYGNVKHGRSPEGYAVKAVHRGTYRDMSGIYEKLGAYMAAHGYAQGDVSWEQYVTDPTSTSADGQITHIYFLINPPGP